jgi:hypothetical protein
MTLKINNLLFWALLAFSVLACNSAEIDHAGNSFPNMDSRYVNWLKSKIESGDFCAEKDCEIGMVLEKMEKGEEYCAYGLPDTTTFIFGDINEDGFIDAVANVAIFQCDGGNALRNANILLFFISEGKKGYRTIEDPAQMTDEIRSVKQIAPNGEVVLEVLEYGEEDPQCCPSVRKKSYFKYRNEVFVGTE